MKITYEKGWDKARYKNEIRELLQDCHVIRDALGLKRWDLSIYIASTSPDDTPDEPPTLALTNALSGYKSATTNFYLESILEKHESPRVTAIHEFLHIALSPYTDAAELSTPPEAHKLLCHIEEALVTDMERLPLWDSLFE